LLNELITERAITVEAIAQREYCSVRKVNMTISLAFLAPDLVKAAIEGVCPMECGPGTEPYKSPTRPRQSLQRQQRG